MYERSEGAERSRRIGIPKEGVDGPRRRSAQKAGRQASTLGEGMRCRPAGQILDP